LCVDMGRHQASQQWQPQMTQRGSGQAHLFILFIGC
jgi:hypothetical protein